MAAEEKATTAYRSPSFPRMFRSFAQGLLTNEIVV
jgi:hypothetical protein